MKPLRFLKPAARALLSEDFRRGDGGTLDASDLTMDTDLGRELNLDPLAEVLDEAQRRFSEPSKSDAWLGPRLHAALRLSRREAANKSLWDYLTIVAFPEYVRWRWNPEDKETPVALGRFAGAAYENALAKLWWATELVRNGSDYSPAAEILRTDRFRVWQKLDCVHHKVAAVAAVRFLSTYGGSGATTEQALEMAKRVNFALRTVSLDSLAPSPAVDADAVRDWVRERIDVTTILGDELPAGPDEASLVESDIETVRQFLEDLALRIDLGSVRRRRRGSIVPRASGPADSDADEVP